MRTDVELALLQFIRLDRSVSYDDETQYWNSTHILIQEIYSGLQVPTPFSIGGLHEILTVTVSCIGGPLPTTLLATRVLCGVIEALGSSLDEQVLKFVLDKILSFMDSPNVEERDVLSCMLHALYSNNIQHRTDLRLIFGLLVTQPLRGLAYHQGTPQVLEVIHLIIQGFQTPMKPQNISFCFQFVVPLLQLEMLDTFHESLFKCLCYIALAVPGVACELTSVCLRLCPNGKESLIPMLYNFALDLISIISPQEYFTIQVFLYEVTAKLLRVKNTETALRIFEDSFVSQRLYANCLIAKPFLLPALQNAILVHQDPFVTTRCGNAMRVIEAL